MLTFPAIEPSFQLGPFTVHWYGVMYLVGFALAWWLGRRRAARPGWGWRITDVDDLILAAALGVVLGGRLGWVLFYGLERAIADPLSIVRVDQGGMSFHGGLLGVLVAMAIFARRTHRTFFEVTDFLAPLVPLGLLAGRFGNFINGELWGKETDLPWGMVFASGGPHPRHPSMLYEAFLEGVVLFAILWWFSAKHPPTRAVSGLFLVGYGTFRILVEFVRVPDADLGYLGLGWVTMGQVLSLPMVLIGAVLIWTAYRKAAGRPALQTATATEESDESATPKAGPAEQSEPGEE